MKNKEVAEIFYAIADILDIKSVRWKPQAYRKAARAIEGLSEDVADIYSKQGLRGLEEIPGVGEGLAKKIAEYVETGKIGEYEKVKKGIPPGLMKILDIQGIGPKKAKALYKKLGVKSVRELENAIKKHKVVGLEGMGEKTEEDISRGIEIVKKSKGKMLLGVAYPIAKDIFDVLSEMKDVQKISVAGSLRRMKEIIRDIDILVVSKNAGKVMNAFTSLNDVKTVLAKGDTKGSVLLNSGVQVDIRIVEDKSFGAAMQYFTGSKEHNIGLRQIAIKKGFKLSEYGVFVKKTGKYVAGKSEKEVYRKLGLPYIEPEIRENTGELKLKNVPELIGYDDIKGDLHVHTKWSDGGNSIAEIAKACQDLGHKYVCISDHSQSSKIAGGLDPDELLKQIKEVRGVDAKMKIKVLTGAEVDIKADGSLDYDDDLLKKLDVVIGSVHSGFKSSKEKMTSRVVKAMSNENLDVLGHPTGRLLKQREGYAIDLDKVFKSAAERNVVMEINSQINRLDLNGDAVKRAIDAGCKLVVNTDAHSIGQLEFMRFGIATARRGWAEKKDVVNTRSVRDVLRLFKKN